MEGTNGMKALSKGLESVSQRGVFTSPQSNDILGVAETGSITQHLRKGKASEGQVIGNFL